MKRMIVAMIAMAALAATLRADTLGGQAGNDTVLRAQNPEQVVDPKATPEVAPQSATAQSSSKDAVKIGKIAQLVLVGDSEFCATENVNTLLEPALCDGAEKTVGDLRRAIAEAKNALISRGFYLVDIYPAKVDAYDEQSKSLELAVEPGRFGDIKITMKNNDGKGDWYGERQVQKRFRHIQPGQPFNYLAFREALRMVNGHPDLMADTKLRFVRVKRDDGDKAGPRVRTTRQLEAEVVVDDSAPFHATVEINNHAMDELDDWQMIATLQDLNLTGVEDVLSISPGVTFDGQMWSIAGSYMRPFDWLLGGSWSVFGGYSDMKCDEVVSRMDLQGIGGFAGVNTVWNLVDTDRRNLAFTLGIMWRQLNDQWSAQSTTLSPREIHILPLSVGLTYGDKRRDWLGGLDFFSISENINLYCDRALFYRYSEDADPNYHILRGSWARLQPIFGPEADGEEWRCWSVFQKLEGQFAWNRSLISPERLAYGGHNCLRGYRKRGYLGDSGVYGSTELRTPVWCNPLTGLLWSDLEMAIERCQFVAFSDYGYITYSGITTSAQQKDEFLWSAGFGVRAALTKYLSLNFDFAVPLKPCYAGDNDENVELYFSIKCQY